MREGGGGGEGERGRGREGEGGEGEGAHLSQTSAQVPCRQEVLLHLPANVRGYGQHFVDDVR